MALFKCSECDHAISDKAEACPQCGAPNVLRNAATTREPPAQQVSLEALQGEVVCPFSGHHMTAGATVCVCGAYHGYKGGVLTDEKFGLLVKLLGLSVVVFFFGFLADFKLPAQVGFVGALILGIVFLFFVLPVRLQGKKWWRQM
jgi:hypothetical protein